MNIRKDYADTLLTRVGISPPSSRRWRLCVAGSVLAEQAHLFECHIYGGALSGRSRARARAAESEHMAASLWGGVTAYRSGRGALAGQMLWASRRLSGDHHCFLWAPLCLVLWSVWLITVCIRQKLPKCSLSRNPRRHVMLEWWIFFFSLVFPQ